MNTHAQKEANTWYLGGQGVGISFDSFVPQPLEYLNDGGAVCGSISDKDGNLLFYTNGFTVWNRENVKMLNGDTINSIKTTSYRNVDIVHLPLNERIYYTFLSGDRMGLPNPPLNGIRYAIIDMTGDSGRGVVISKNNLLLDTTFVDFATTIGTDNSVWAAAVQKGTDVIQTFKLNENGTVSNLKKYNTGVRVEEPNGISNLKFSVDKKKLAFIHATYEWDVFSGYKGYVHVFNIDNTGKITGHKKIVFYWGYLPMSFDGSLNGLEFSPNGKYLYLNEYYIGPYQCNLDSLDDESGFDSVCKKIGTQKTHAYNETYGMLQLAPDGKIYVAKHGFNVPAINYPDSLGEKCGYDSIGVVFKNKPCYWCLPEIVVPNLYAQNICLGDTTEIRLRATAVDSVRWDFGDGNTGFTLTADVKHYYADTGTYPLVAYAYRPDRTDTFYYPLKIYTVKPPALGADRLICSTDSVQYDVSHPTIERYRWNTGSFNPAVTIKQPGRYKVKVENYGCAAEDSVEIKTVHCGYSVKGFCFGDTTQFKLDTASADSVKWDFGNTNKEITVSDSVTQLYSAGNYTVTATLYKDGLSVNSLQNISIKSVKKPSLGNDTLLCQNDSLAIDVSDASYTAYEWSDGASVATAVIKTPGIYWVKVENNGCYQSDTVRVEKNNCSISATNFCQGDTTVFNFSHSADSVLWDFGDGHSLVTSAQQILKKYSNDGNYIASATVFKNNLSRKIPVLITITGLPAFDLGPDTVMCFNSKLDSKINTPGISYLWNDGTTGPFVMVLQSANYVLQIQKSGCVARDSVSLTVEDCQCEVYIPNAFTPTHNNLNDAYAPVAFCDLVNYRLEIFNKWGELIFSSQDINTPWDGTHKQVECPAGLYIYVITYRNSRTLKQYTGSGTVMLVR